MTHGKRDVIKLPTVYNLLTVMNCECPHTLMVEPPRALDTCGLRIPESIRLWLWLKFSGVTVNCNEHRVWRKPQRKFSQGLSSSVSTPLIELCRNNSTGSSTEYIPVIKPLVGRSPFPSLHLSYHLHHHLSLDTSHPHQSFACTTFRS